MTTETLPTPVDTSGAEDDATHGVCTIRQLTWCGVDATDMPMREDVPDVDEVCRICLAAFELHTVGDPCPICGTRDCL